MNESNCLIKLMSAENSTPLALARKLNARVILESATYKRGRSRYSLLLIDEAFSIYQEDGNLYFAKHGKNPRMVKSAARDILDLLQYFADQHSSPHQDFPFPAGGIGFCSFEFAQYCDSITMPRKADQLGLPEATFIFGHSLIIFDHYTDQLYLIALNYKESPANLEQVLASLETRILKANGTQLSDKTRKYSVQEISSGEDNSRYMEMVDSLRSEIISGNLYQAVPSRRRRFKTRMPAINAYRVLRQNNPSPYMFYFDFENYQLFGTSPEMHLRVRDGMASIRPIAGTRRRGATPTEDIELEKDLLNDEKELAEHRMLVDLGRNDLGRVSQPGTVELKSDMIIEKYSRVMHIVSQLDSELELNKTGVDALRATFPAGTVSGAPKIRAIETIHELESISRGFYAGIVGYVEPGGDLDTCITIRSVLCKDGIFNMQAGGGVVYDSNAEREFQETEEKMSALLNAIGL